MIGVDQLFQHPRQALLGDLENVEQFGDGKARHAVDEMQHAMMRAAKAVTGQNLIGVRREVPIREEQEFDQAKVNAVGFRDRRLDRNRLNVTAVCHAHPVPDYKICQ